MLTARHPVLLFQISSPSDTPTHAMFAGAQRVNVNAYDRPDTADNADPGAFRTNKYEYLFRAFWFFQPELGSSREVLHFMCWERKNTTNTDIQ